MVDLLARSGGWGRWFVIASLAAAPVIIINCGNQNVFEPESAEPAKPTGPRTVEVKPRNVASGGEKWKPCSRCHGDQGEGRIGAGPSLNSESFLAAASDEFLFETIKHGRAGSTMPSWEKSDYSDRDIEDVIAFIRSWKEVPPAELDESPLKGDIKAGEVVFSSICAACHGRTGAGYQETANGTGIGRRAFLNVASNGYLRYIVKHGKSGTQMRSFIDGTNVADLTDADIENVIAYLRDAAW